MQRHAIALIALQTMTFCFCGHAAAQLTISQPDPVTKPTDPARPSNSEGIVAARQAARSCKQIRVKVQYLMVDAATRMAIYQHVDTRTLRTTTQIPKSLESLPLDETQARSTQQLSSPSRVTSCVLSDADMQWVVQKAIQSQLSDVAEPPSVMLLDGTQTEMNDVVQRPFVVDMQADGEVVKPAMHVVDDGTRLRLLAELTDESGDPGHPIQLTCEISTSRILDVKSDHVFGVQNEPLVVQVPIHQVVTATAFRQLAKGQTLLVDPHVAKTRRVQSESKVPVLAKLPWVGRSFKNTVVDDVSQHLILLLQPSIEAK